MEAKALTPRDLFDGKVCLEIPPFQRPYVWNEEDQWQPLWDDLERVTVDLLAVNGDEGGADRLAFEHVMDNALSVTPELCESRIAQAHAFFLKAIKEWAEVGGDADKARVRLTALAQVLQQHLRIVAIDLGDNDDDQLIFETLNGRGTPLLAADHIKNYVFQRGEDLHADVDAWSDAYWQDLDEDWWRDQVAQGRLYRSRIDLFLQYWL